MFFWWYTYTHCMHTQTYMHTEKKRSTGLSHTYTSYVHSKTNSDSNLKMSAAFDGS